MEKDKAKNNKMKKSRFQVCELFACLLFQPEIEIKIEEITVK